MSADKLAEYREHEARMLREGGYKTELEMTISPQFRRLRASHAALLAAVKDVVYVADCGASIKPSGALYAKLRAAIAAAGELTP